MLDAECRAVAAHATALAALTPGRTGNLSVRRDDHVAITPTGVEYDRIEAADVPVLSLDGEQVEGRLEPSSETPLHLAAYERLDVGAVVHTHSPWATTLSILREPVPPVHYMLALAGTSVPVAEYATYGTDALAENAVVAMEDAGSGAVLLANHGLVATGPDLRGAIETAQSVEFTARTYAQARALGTPVELDDAEMQEAADQFAGYGQQA